MDWNPKTLAILVVIFIIAFKVIWTLLGDFDDVFEEFWEEIKRPKDELDDDEEDTDRTQSGKK